MTSPSSTVTVPGFFPSFMASSTTSPYEVREPIQQSEANGAAVETKHVVVGVAIRKAFERMNAGAVVSKKTVADSNDCDVFCFCRHFGILSISKS